MSVIAFWAVAMLVGGLALPIAFVLFRRMPDAGAGLAFPLGLVLVGYGYFILRVATVLPQGRGGYLVAIALLALVSCAVAGRDRRFASTFRRSVPALLTVSGLFGMLFFAFTAFRSFTPEIGGTEQPMDLMYLNATLQSPDYPPTDPWLAGEEASYYYFGYLQIGVLTAAANVPTSVGYNLGLAYTFAAAGTAIASLAYAMARRILGSRGQRWAVWAGGLAVALLLFTGSLAAIFEWGAAHGEANAAAYRAFDMDWRISCDLDEREYCYDGPAGDRTDAWYPTEFFWWFSLTRIVPGTISEFPLFSFILGDLHPHVMAIPLVLLAVGLAMAVWQGRSRLSLGSHRRPWFGLLLGLVFGALAFQNAWDVITFSGLLALAVLARNARTGGLRRALRDSALFLGPPALVGIAAYLPWYAGFSSQAEGIFPYIGAGSLPTHAFLHFGPVLVGTAVLFAWAFKATDRRALADFATISLWAPLVPFFVWLLVTTGRGELQDAIDGRGGGGWVTLAVFAAGAWAAATATLSLTAGRRAAAPVAAVAAAALLLLYGSELFYVGDVFDSVPRLNTVFKLSYQAWILLSLGGAVAIAVALEGAARRRAWSGWLAVPAVLVAAGGMLFALFAIPNRTDGFEGETAIDGLAYLARTDPGEYALTRWMSENVDPGDVIIEASGRTWRRGQDGRLAVTDAGSDYTDSGRISARTGLATPIGWYFHEVQWRGQSAANRAEFTRRQDLVDGIYLAEDVSAVAAKMREAGARYLVVGRAEQTRYPTETLERLDGVLDVAFESGNVRLYRLPEREVVTTS